MWLENYVRHIVGQGPAVLAAGSGRVGYIFYIFHLSSLSNVLSFGRRLNMTEILWFRLLKPTVVVSYCRGRPRLVLVNRLEGLSLPRNSATINWPARHDLVVDWAVKLQHKQNIDAVSFLHARLITSYMRVVYLRCVNFRNISQWSFGTPRPIPWIRPRMYHAGFHDDVMGNHANT